MKKKFFMAKVMVCDDDWENVWTMKTYCIRGNKPTEVAEEIEDMVDNSEYMGCQIIDITEINKGLLLYFLGRIALHEKYRELYDGVPHFGKFEKRIKEALERAGHYGE